MKHDMQARRKRGAEQLTLYQPGGQIMPTTVLQAPSIFQTLRRPCAVYIELQIKF